MIEILFHRGNERSTKYLFCLIELYDGYIYSHVSKFHVQFDLWASISQSKWAAFGRPMHRLIQYTETYEMRLKKTLNIVSLTWQEEKYSTKKHKLTNNQGDIQKLFFLLGHLSILNNRKDHKVTLQKNKSLLISFRETSRDISGLLILEK